MQKHKTFNHFISYYTSTEALSITDSKRYNVELIVNSLNLNSKLWQSLRRKRDLLFLWRQVGFLSAELTEATATITWREDEERVWVAEPRRPCCRMGSEDECRRPWKKELRKGRAEHRRGRSCMAGLPAGKSCG